jgi:Protein of unknown function (DUF2798)
MSNLVSTSKKLPAKYAMVVLPLILSVIMTFIISGVSTLRGVGLSPLFAATWMSAWGLSWLVAFPTLLVVLPFVRRVVGMVVAAPGRSS